MYCNNENIIQGCIEKWSLAMLSQSPRGTKCFTQ